LPAHSATTTTEGRLIPMRSKETTIKRTTDTQLPSSTRTEGRRMGRSDANNVPTNKSGQSRTGRNGSSPVTRRQAGRNPCGRQTGTNRNNTSDRETSGRVSVRSIGDASTTAGVNAGATEATASLKTVSVRILAAHAGFACTTFQSSSWMDTPGSSTRASGSA